jgi:hypothetical protein
VDPLTLRPEIVSLLNSGEDDSIALAMLADLFEEVGDPRAVGLRTDRRPIKLGPSYTQSDDAPCGARWRLALNEMDAFASPYAISEVLYVLMEGSEPFAVAVREYPDRLAAYLDLATAMVKLENATN